LHKGISHRPSHLEGPARTRPGDVPKEMQLPSEPATNMERRRRRNCFGNDRKGLPLLLRLREGRVTTNPCPHGPYAKLDRSMPAPKPVVSSPNAAAQLLKLPSGIRRGRGQAYATRYHQEN